MALDTEGDVKAAKRQGHPIAQGRDGRDVEAVEVDLGFCLFSAKLFHARPRARTAKLWVKAVGMPVSVALHLKGGPGREPGGKGFGDTQTELIEAEVGRPGISQRGRPAGELGDHLDMGVIAKRANDKGGQL